MSKKIQINIPTPCHESWDHMNPIEKGRFCNSCNKAVIDFTNMSDREIAQFFKKPVRGGTCGRFLQEQLERDIALEKKRLPWVRYFFQVAIPTVLFIKPAYSQGSPRLIDKPQQFETPVKKGIRIGDTIRMQNPTLRGVITDSVNKQPVSFASIFVKEIGRGVVADSSGNFSIDLPAGIPSVTLKVSSIGYESIEKICMINNDPVHVMMQNSVSDMGVVVVSSTVSRVGCYRTGGLVNVIYITESFIDTVVKWIFPEKRPTIFPNPVLRGHQSTIEWQSRSDEQLKIVVQTANGDVVISLQFRLTKGTNRLQLPTGSTWAAGIYFIRFFNTKDKQVATEKIVIY